MNKLSNFDMIKLRYENSKLNYLKFCLDNKYLAA